MKSSNRRPQAIAIALGIMLLLSAEWSLPAADSASTSVLITAVYYDTYLAGEPDEAFRLMNVSGAAVDLTSWTVTDFEGAIRHVVGQDYRSLSASVDVFSPMVYHKLCGRDVPWIAEITKWAWEETGKAVLPIVQAVDEPEPLKPQELHQVLKTALAAPGSQGAIIFNLGVLTPKKITVMEEVFGGVREP